MVKAGPFQPKKVNRLHSAGQAESIREFKEKRETRKRIYPPYNGT